MKKTNHKFYYFSLIALLIISFGSLLLIGSNKYLQSGIILFTGILYVAFGVLHHYFDHDLHAKIVIEYIIVACMGAATLFFLFHISL